MRRSRTSIMDRRTDKSPEEVTMPCVYTFVPTVQRLPVKSSLESTSAASDGKQHENVAQETTKEEVSGEKPGRDVYNQNLEEREEENSTQSHGNKDVSRALPHSLVFSSASFGDQSENTSHGGKATMEATSNKHTDISLRRHQCASGRASEVRLGCHFKTEQDRLSPTCSADLFPTPASSRESILSACSDKDASPLSGSRTISPCSSVYSGVFTPSLVPVKKHFLAPGSSLISLPQSLRSSCESLSCPMSPNPNRHRPPLTRLSLLTAILRKGRLPVLSSAVRRPYTPCWPVNNVTLSQCRACSAASSVASIPFALSSDFSSTTSIDSQSEAFRDPTRCATAPPLLCKTTCPQNQIKASTSNTVPRRQQGISPLPPSTLTSQRNPQPVGSSIVKSLSPLNRSYISVSKPKYPVVMPSICSSVVNMPNKLTCLSPEPAFELDTGVPQNSTHLPNYSVSKLQSSSPQLKSTASCSSEKATSAFPPSPPPAQLAAGRPRVSIQSEPQRSHHLSRCLPLSRYTPIAFPGWPSPSASPSPTPTPSPAPPIRELTPSPSLSLRSTPSPRPGSRVSDGSDREGKRRKPHKIKSSYKSLAAIPTNTLLLDQQVIDEQVERGRGSAGDGGVPTDPEEADTRREMCSPAWMRKESEELYAVIDELLGNSPVPPKSKSPVVKEAQKSSSTCLHTYGRETKYSDSSRKERPAKPLLHTARVNHSVTEAALQGRQSLLQGASVGSLKPPGNDQRRADLHKTKPGVIRCVTNASVTAQDPQMKSECRPSRHFVSQHISDSTKGRSTVGVDSGLALGAEEHPPGPSACDLHITEPEEPVTPPPKHGLTLGSSALFGPAERKLRAFQTQI